MNPPTDTGLSLDDIRYDSSGLVPAIVQDSRTGEVLMLAYMSADSLAKTIETGETWFWSRSRGELWHKGATSGDTQSVRWLRTDCDGDTLLIGVELQGSGACHVEGRRSCFFQEVSGISGDEPGSFNVLPELARVIESRNLERPAGSYTTTLFERGIDKIAQKVGEEAVEVVIASMNYAKEPNDELPLEVADLLYHLLVLAEFVGLDRAQVFAELAKRRGKSGLRDTPKQ